MDKNAYLLDIYDSPRDVRGAFMDSVELNGNPFYHRWHIGRIYEWDQDEVKRRKSKVDNWLKLQGLNDNDIVILTGGW